MLLPMIGVWAKGQVRTGVESKSCEPPRTDVADCTPVSGRARARGRQGSPHRQTSRGSVAQPQEQAQALGPPLPGVSWYPDVGSSDRICRCTSLA